MVMGHIIPSERLAILDMCGPILLIHSTVTCCQLVYSVCNLMGFINSCAFNKFKYFDKRDT